MAMLADSVRGCQQMKPLYVKDRMEWRSWLGKNSRSCKEVWLLYFKKNSGKQRITYEDAVQEGRE